MDLMKKSKEISDALNEYKITIEQDIKKYEEELKEYNDNLIRASADGDRSENAAFDQALKDIALTTSDKALSESLLDAIKSCQEGEKNYIHKGKITNYSVVHLVRIDLADTRKQVISRDYIDDELVYKLYPNGVSRPLDGIISSTDSVVGISLIGKQKGDTIKIRHQINIKSAEFEIEDYY